MEEIEQIKKDFLDKIASVQSDKELIDVEVEFLGRKGKLTGVLRGLGELSVVEKKRIGSASNELKVFIEQEIGQKKDAFRMQKWQDIAISEKQDINAPESHVVLSGDKNGSTHPLTGFIFKIESIFEEMGYEVVEGYEIETDYYNFTAVGIPENHPTRDDHDTFYVKNLENPEEKDLLLRTQTTAMQVRYMQEKKNDLPIKIIVPGKTFRRDDDATHSPMFHQFEGLVIDKGVTMGELKNTLSQAMKKLLGEDTKIRFRSSYFPFVEPGLEVDVSCSICGGKGCNVCKNTGWIELLGAGMVHPDVLRNGGIDPEIYSGFAFGTGIERLAMMHHKIPSIKMLYENDLRFLRQF